MTKSRKPKTVVPEITCDEFKRRAIEAAKIDNAKREKEVRDRKLKQATEAYSQLRVKLPLLNHVEGVFTMCGYVFRTEWVGMTSDGRSDYILISDLSYIHVYDEVSFGRFLNEVESKKAKPVPKGFWARLFS